MRPRGLLLAALAALTALPRLRALGRRDRVGSAGGASQAPSPVAFHLRAGACVSPEGLKQIIDGLQSQAVALLAEQVGATESIVAQAQLERTALGELQGAEEAAAAARAACVREAEEAQHDLEMYRRELKELAQIARADVQVYDWGPLALLGARSVLRSSSVSLDVQRAAEHHFGLVKAARRASACKARENENDVELIQEGEVQAPFTPDPLGGHADPGACRAEQDRLRESYVEAYVRMTSLVEIAEAAADQEGCLKVADDLLAEQRVPLERELDRVRQELCSAHQAGDRAAFNAGQLRGNLETARTVLVAEHCGEATWRTFEDVLKALLEVGNGRPECSQCCGRSR